MKTKIFRAGQCYRENRLLPVLTKSLINSPILNTKDISRSIIKGEDMYCLLVQPNGNNAIFIDAKGTEYLVTKDDLNRTFSYRNSLFQKREAPLYTVRRGITDKFTDIAKTVLERPDIIRKYKGWLCSYGVLGEDSEVSESVSSYKVGGLYETDEGGRFFIVTSVSSDSLRYIDLSDEKEYNVGMSESLISNSNLIEIIPEFEYGLEESEYDTIYEDRYDKDYQNLVDDIMAGKKTVKARDEKSAVSAFNKLLKVDKGDAWKIVNDKGGYFGKYTFAETTTLIIGGKSKTRTTGSTWGSFDIVEAGKGFYKVQTSKGAGYQGQD